MLQMLYSVRSERLLMEEIDYSIVFRWFIGSVPSTLKCSSETSPRSVLPLASQAMASTISPLRFSISRLPLLTFRQIETEHDSNGDMRNRFHAASSFTLRPASTEKYE